MMIIIIIVTIIIVTIIIIIIMRLWYCIVLIVYFRELSGATVSPKGTHGLSCRRNAGRFYILDTLCLMMLQLGHSKRLLCHTYWNHQDSADKMARSCMAIRRSPTITVN